MKQRVKPWGAIEWLLPKLGENKWHFIAASSFEDRCSAAIEWMHINNQKISSATLMHIDNPPSAHWDRCQEKLEKNRRVLQSYLDSGGIKPSKIQTGLITPPALAVLGQGALSVNSDSVILDISTMPKRLFLLALKILLENSEVKNLLVTYSHAQSYPEATLCEEAMPPVSLQGYARTKHLNPNSNSPKRLVMGVGYVALNMSDFFELAKGKKTIDFLFPFPPASPAFRRNWKLLSLLMPDELRDPSRSVLHRVNGMDAFRVYEQLTSWGQYDELNLLPLGPKPHVLGMAMAYLRLGGTAELIYAQPRVYSPDYSIGILRDENEHPKVTAYCLKKDGEQLF